VDRHADRMADELSGGERQRAWIAMLLAQNSPFLLLDEPTSALDLAHQYEIMSLLAALAHENGRGVVVVLHDINLAARFADRIVVLKDGIIAFDGPSHELLAPDLLSRLCGLDMRLVDHPTAATRVAVVNW
jgi:ferric hydroxamate transport system ATP-binding protein